MAFSANSFICNSEILAFKGRKDVLSNFYPCHIFYKNIWFNCSEQIYQYEKAIFHGITKDALKSQLMLLKTPYEQKKWAKRITVRDAWMEVRREVMKNILRAKLECVREYKQVLLQSKGVLVEAVPGERFWSSGLSKTDVYRRMAEDWPGQNELGKIHMELRTEIKALQTSLLEKKRLLNAEKSIAPEVSINAEELQCTITANSMKEAHDLADKHYIPRNTVRIVMPSKQPDMCTTSPRKKRVRATTSAAATGAPAVKRMTQETITLDN